ncbi:MAG: prepilin-type N-terminal cleavage/methylation domain-containing protein [Bacilli bacterium]|nr:prepilin-type N-terminal cleavage/methylation domain-containing protein [Bacilli bacterium]
MKKEKGFTLIELLAVIIILAIMALISIPLILNLIEKAKKNAFEESAYGIMESVRLYYMENIIDNKELGDKVFSYEEEEKELKYSGTRPKGGTIILKKNGNLEMFIHNFKWCAIKNEEEHRINIIDYDKETCKIESPMILEGSSVEDIELGLDSPIPGSYYNLKNQKGIVTCVNLSDENREIKNTSELKIGENCIKCSMIYEKEEIASLTRTFKMIKTGKTADEIMKESPGRNGIIVTDLDGNKRFAGSDPNNYISFNGDLFRIIGVFDGKMKIMQYNFYGSTGKISWNGGNLNDWNQPGTLNITLNGTYWNSISSEYQNAVDQNHIWNIGGIDNSNMMRSNFYRAENTKQWTGNVGLMSVADFAYASSYCNDSINLNSVNNACTSNNWMLPTNYNQWTITPYTGDQNNVWIFVVNGSFFTAYNSNNAHGVRPVLFLNQDIRIIGGNGTNSNPYILNL